MKIPSEWPASQVEMRALEDLVFYARNSRTHSAEQVEQIAASMREWGWTNPVLVDEHGTIIAGHGRVMAAKKLGIAQAPVMVCRGWTEDQKRAYVIADNKLALNAGWDLAKLAVELNDLAASGFAVGLTGFSDDELARMAGSGGGLTDPDDAPELWARPVSRPGDVWILGAHRVTCGDATVLADVERVMAGHLADACWTDPPYNVNYESKLAGKIKNDHMGDAKFRAFLYDAFTSVAAVLQPGGAFYVAHADTEGLNFRAAFVEAGFKLLGCLVWVKDSLVLGRSDYQWQHEPILYGWKPGASHAWFGGRKKTTVQELGSPAITVNDDGAIVVRIGAESFVITGKGMEIEGVVPSVIRCEKPKRSVDHPTMKPVELIQRMLENSTKIGAVVLDPFGGSGSTLIACETLGRQARLVELDPKFVDVIVRRWQAFTGKAAFLEGSPATFEDVADARYDFRKDGFEGYEVWLEAKRAELAGRKKATAA
jgi:DNA modification methylase